MTIPAHHFEAKKHAYRQTQDGIVVSFVVHPNDVTPSLAMAALGTRFMVALAEIGDDEKPKEPDATPAGAVVAEASGATDRRDDHPIPDRKLSSQCALRCKDWRFWKWLSIPSAVTIDSEEKAVARVRAILHVKSRSQIDSDHNIGAAWQRMEHRFQSHLTSQMHAGSYR